MSSIKSSLFFFMMIREIYSCFNGNINKAKIERWIIMMTFLMIVGAIIVANLFWVFAMLMVFRSKRFQKWMVRWITDYSKVCLEEMDFYEEES